MEVLWTEPAEAHLAAIHAHLSLISPLYADHIVDRITARTGQLARFPRSGAVIPGAHLLEIRTVTERPYRILYVIGSNHIDILAVLHGSRESI